METKEEKEEEEGDVLPLRRSEVPPNEMDDLGDALKKVCVARRKPVMHAHLLFVPTKLVLEPPWDDEPARWKARCRPSHPRGGERCHKARW
jgi:hypothetical protein